MRHAHGRSTTAAGMALSTVEPLLAAFMTWCALLSWRGLGADAGRITATLAVAGVLVAAVGWVLRQLSPHWWVVLPVQGLVVWLWLQHRVTGDWLPGLREIELFGTWLVAGADAGQRYTSPVSADYPAFAFLLIASGTGLLLLVDFLACTLGRAPLAGLPLLLVITISASLLLQAVSWLIFAGAALCWLALMAWQESQLVRDWAARARDAADPPSEDGEHGGSLAGPLGLTLGSMSLRIGLVCALVAIVPTALLSSEGRQLGSIGQGEGAGSIVTANPLLDMRANLRDQSDAPFISVRTDGDAPRYVRLAVLDVFTPSAWRTGDRTYGSTGPVEGSLPPAPGLLVENQGRTQPWSIAVSRSFRSTWLPLPYPTDEVDVGRGWRYDADTLDVVAVGGTNAAGLSYRAQAVPVNVDEAAVRLAGTPPAAIKDSMTRLPGRLPAVFEAAARRVTRGAQNDFDKAIALQDWFRDKGTYSLDRQPGNGLTTLERFVSADGAYMEGYCEQFSTAMAVMARTLGIPARVTTGFLSGEKQGEQWVFTGQDLHAWPELYFRGVGWIRFEPTPSIAAAPGYTRDRGADRQEEAPLVTEAPSDLPSQAAPSQRPEATNSDSTGGDASPLRWVVPPLVLLLAGLLLLGPRALRGWVTRRRWTRATTPGALAEAAWEEVRDTAQDLDLAWDADASVRSNRDRLHDQVLTTPEADEALDQVVRYVESARYAPVRAAAAGTTVLERPSSVREDVEVWQRTIAASVDPRRARRARWFPRSLLKR